MRRNELKCAVFSIKTGMVSVNGGYFRLLIHSHNSHKHTLSALLLRLTHKLAGGIILTINVKICKK